jgi:hypothetical protein
MAKGLRRAQDKAIEKLINHLLPVIEVEDGEALMTELSAVSEEYGSRICRAALTRLRHQSEWLDRVLRSGDIINPFTERVSSLTDGFS